MRTVIGSMRIAIGSMICLVAGLAGPRLAVAENYDYVHEYDKRDWPMMEVERPLTLPRGMVELAGDTFILGYSRGEKGKGTSFAPSLHVGITHELTVGVFHQVGICWFQCERAYHDVGLEVVYALSRRGRLHAAVHVGPRLAFTEPNAAGPSVGITARLRVGRFALLAEPRLYVGVSRRDRVADTLSLPVALQVQFLTRSLLFTRAELAVRSDDLDAAAVPVGVGVLFAMTPGFDFGFELRYLNLLGTDGTSAERSVITRLTLRL